MQGFKLAALVMASVLSVSALVWASIMLSMTVFGPTWGGIIAIAFWFIAMFIAMGIAFNRH
jgi:hypothetical protein